ncbi:phosphotransferase [Amycolatopsis rhabdoformis]|uniref:Phosphotransferase n=1 Tax=Amycolatopsis rhabdoformis TaxID=1448059 RepID=A0ABZ1I4L1_9PSEU|nr:phosphotransferase [Amycolatopsis rhabdoformis]WSE28414.1 phosphotransferase [Amycolatopsis rhabdoformis]
MWLGEGWDSVATLVDARWVERRPRRAEVRELLLRETRVMPWLAPLLPVRVPVPVVWQAEPLVVRHELVVGEQANVLTAEHGRTIGALLRALHAVDIDEAGAHGVAATDRADVLAEFAEVVVPRAGGAALLDEIRGFPVDAVVHADLGPEHVLVIEGQVSGVIDWSDLCVDDRARDLAWPMFGASAAFARGVAAAYGMTEELHRRAWAWHRLAPWFEVTHGVATGQPDLVDSGLAGVRERLAGHKSALPGREGRQG